MPDPLERAMADLAFGPAFDARDAAAVQAWLARNGVSETDARAIEGRELERLSIYRQLVRGNLREALKASIGRTVARLGGVFEEYFDGYLAESGPRTHYLRDVTPAFLEYCAPRFATDARVPPWMLDLARHEAVQIELGAMEAGCRDAQPELDLERPVRFVEATRIMRYQFAVHRMSEDETDRTPPDPAPTSLLVYRSPEHEVRYLELTPLAADILSRLLDSESLSAAIYSACEAAGAALDQTLLESTARLLADLAERGALLGSKPA